MSRKPGLSALAYVLLLVSCGGSAESRSDGSAGTAAGGEGQLTGGRGSGGIGSADTDGEGGRAGAIMGSGGRALGEGGINSAGASAGSGTSSAGSHGDGGAAGADSGGCSDVCGTPGCGDCPATGEFTPSGADFTIFETEVTNGQYAAFLATNPSVEIQVEKCSWNGSFTPPNAWPAGKDDHPVVWVDWCDAYAYCAWAGRRLCGRIGGGALGYGEFENPDEDQWFNACTTAGANVYPYGDEYEPATCNGAESGAGATLPVASLSGCAPDSENGPFDMSGNVWEWQDSCADDELGEDDPCHARGGSYLTAEPDLLRCRTATTTYTRTNVKANLGFRCCSD